MHQRIRYTSQSCITPSPTFRPPALFSTFRRTFPTFSTRTCARWGSMRISSLLAASAMFSDVVSARKCLFRTGRMRSDLARTRFSRCFHAPSQTGVFSAASPLLQCIRNLPMHGMWKMRGGRVDLSHWPMESPWSTDRKLFDWR